MDGLVLDTSVLIDYIVLRSPYREAVAGLLERARRGELRLYVSAVTLSELLYVSSRVYEAAGSGDPNREALDFVRWVRSRVQVVDVNEAIALRAGELRKRLRIALPDCYVIASAEAVRAVPLFRGLEDEMRPVESELRALGVRFLDGIRP